MSSDWPVRKTLKVVLLTLGALGLLTLLSCGGLFYWGQGRMQEAEASADAFLDQLAAGDMDEAYGRTSSSFRANTSRERFSELLGKYPLLAKPTTRTRGAWRVRGTPQGAAVFLQYKLVDPNSSLPLELILVREDAWKVISLNLP